MGKPTLCWAVDEMLLGGTGKGMRHDQIQALQLKGNELAQTIEREYSKVIEVAKQQGGKILHHGISSWK